MSRIGKAIINIPAGVTVNYNNGEVKVKGPKGEFIQKINPEFGLEIENGVATVKRPSEEKTHRAQHGLYRSLINNAIIGVSTGHNTVQELVGVGYKASNDGQLLDLTVGYSHRIILQVPSEVKLETITEKGKNPTIKLESVDKQLVGQIAAKIRSFRKPEPFKGKGIKFTGEVLRKKAGKSGGKK